MSNITKKALENMKAMMQQAKFNSVDNTDEQALEVQALYPDWSVLPEGYNLKAGDRVNYLGALYNVLQTHQKQSAWNPVDAPSLFAKVLNPDADIIPEWEQPDSTNGYMVGDKVKHNDVIYESLVDNNVWEPGTTGMETLWKVVIE